LGLVLYHHQVRKPQHSFVLVITLVQ
jgi:hypothetical protein